MVKKIGIPILMLGVSGLLTAWLANQRNKPERQEREDSIPVVTTAKVTSAPSSFDIQTNGIVAPKREIKLAAEVAGKVVTQSPKCNAGQFVKKGEFLLRIDPRTYELEIKRLESESKETEVDLVQLEIERANINSLIKIAELDLSIANRELSRLKRLSTSGAASESERDQAASTVAKAENTLQTQKNSLDLMSARKDRLEAQKELKNAQLEKAKLDLEKTSVFSPIDGIIANESVEENQFVQPGTSLITLEETSALEVRCSLRLSDLYWLWRSADQPSSASELEAGSVYHAPRVKATIHYRLSGQSFVWDGFLSRFEGIGVDEKTRTIACRVEVPDPVLHDKHAGPRRLVRGMFVHVQLQATPNVALLSIPTQAFQPHGEVWVVRDSKLKILQVEPAKMLDDSVLVLADTVDLQPGDNVVISPMSTPVNGMKVKVADQSDGGQGAGQANRETPLGDFWFSPEQDDSVDR